MKLTPEEAHYEPKRFLYWTRIIAEFDEDTTSTTVMVCASRQYISDKYKLSVPITDEHIETWLNDVIKELETESEEFKGQEEYRKAYSFTAEGQQNGMEFLQGVVA